MGWINRTEQNGTKSMTDLFAEEQGRLVDGQKRWRKEEQGRGERADSEKVPLLPNIRAVCGQEWEVVSIYTRNTDPTKKWCG